MSCGAYKPPMSFGKSKRKSPRKSFVRSALDLPGKLVSGTIHTIKKPFNYLTGSSEEDHMSHKSHSRRRKSHSRRRKSHSRRRKYHRRSRFGKHKYVPVAKRLCKRHHRRRSHGKRHSKSHSKSHRRHRRGSRFGAFGPGYPGPVSYPMGTSVNYFGAREPFINPSSWWYPQGGVPTNLIPNTVKPQV